MRYAKMIIATLLALIVLAVGTCLAQGEGLQIVCTSYPCYDFARAVAGDNAEISLLIHPGSEVHLFEPTPADVLKISECDLFIYIGGESDSWVGSILRSFDDDAPGTLCFFDYVEKLHSDMDEEHEHEHEYDEHIWTAPSNAIKMIDALCNALCEIAPEHTEEFEANAQSYSSQITQIDTEIRSIVNGAARKELVFADRFPFIYFTREYGLDYTAAFPSCASESEPSARTMVQLIEQVKNDHIPVVYIIELSAGKTAKTVAEETGAQIMTMYSLQNISESDFSAAETYVSLMWRNVEALRAGLN